MTGSDMKNVLMISVSIILLAILSGCATRRQVEELQIQVEAMRTDQTAIRAENARLDSLFRVNAETSRKLNADFASYADRLDQRLQTVEARLEDAISLINRSGGARGVSTNQNLNPQTDTSRAESTQTQPGIDCQKIYNAAYLDFVKEQYDMAIKGFKGYLQTCPGTGLDDNAQYWIGESYYVQKSYEKAQDAFQEVITKYPESERLAAAKLKLGESLYALRQKAKARALFEDVIKNNPGTQEAQEAANMLNRYR